MKQRISLLLYFLTATLSLVAQRTSVAGYVENAVTGDRLAGATVAAEGVKVVTNGDGFFTLKSENAFKTITVTHLGYRTKTVRTGHAPYALLNIKLQPADVQLREILIVPEDPRQLVMAAIRRIPSNYCQVPEMYCCFYRETAMKRQHYICLAEGVVDMYKTSYKQGIARDRVAIRKGRRLLSPRQNDTLSVKVMGGPLGPVQFDVAKNLELLLNEAELDCYDMKMLPPESIADRQQYVVALSPRRAMDWPLFYGKLYIDQKSLSFTCADLQLDMNDRDKATRAMLVKKPMGVRFRPKEFSILADYLTDDDGLTRINYVRTTLRFNCDWRRKLFATSFTATCEMVVTSSHGGSDVQPIRGRESFDQRDAFFDKVEFFRDSTFWLDYNIIEPTESLDKAIKRLLKK